MGLAFSVYSDDANAAKRRAAAAPPPPPPPPPTEKNGPNVSGVQAKVLASKRRKEAMKEEIAKLREKGKPKESGIEKARMRQCDQQELDDRADVS
ncbi:hypothetical protein AXF42_Ash008262 [Apostasia shenzhenica]|uniref:Uncharacterized protein n=1 Tax=Apostasia shenzhenica TaxID=1088818 RepID=A0A2I0AXD2_9ASPA|nr:hypothetical protein AXF42_Ash008262 [Apostasia shenzhenica]